MFLSTFLSIYLSVYLSIYLYIYIYIFFTHAIIDLVVDHSVFGRLIFFSYFQSVTVSMAIAFCMVDFDI